MFPWSGRSAMDLGMKWLKAPFHLWVPDGLEDCQIGWHIYMARASLKSEMFGYLILCKQECRGCSACLWRVAGARHQDFFLKKSPVVIAAWEQAQIAERRVLFFPPIVHTIDAQLKRLKYGKEVLEKSEESTAVHREGTIFSPSQSDLGFDLNNQNQKHKTCNTRASVRETGYMQADFDAMDLRKMSKAYEGVESLLKAQPSLTSEDILEIVCERTGITISRALQLKEIQKQWPEKASATAKAAAGD